MLVMTAASRPVKMAACLPQDGDTGDPDHSGSSSLSHSLKQQSSGIQGGVLSSSDTSEAIKAKGDKAYDEVLKYPEDELRNLLEEVTNAGKRKDKSSLSPFALALILREEDALREESSSGDDTRDLIQRCRNKKFLGRRHQASGDQQSAAACTSTGGSLGSLHDLSETKQPKKVAGPNQGVASRCREGGSCGNLSRGSFETQPPRKKKGRRYRDAARASASQREGGSLQNLSKTEAASNESKKLHKSGSLSQVCSEVASGARSKNRRQKTASESSSSRYPRRSEDREGGDDSSGDEDNNRCRPKAQLLSGVEGIFPPEGVGGASGGLDPSHADDSMSDVASEGESTDEEVEAVRAFSGRKCSNAPIEENGIELQTVTCHRSDFDNPHTEVDKGINFSLTRPQGDTMLGSGHRTLLLQNYPPVSSAYKEEKSTNKCMEEDNAGKRKLTGNRSEMGGCENKASLDENGNPVMSTSGVSVNSAGSGGDRSSTVVQTTSRKNVINTSLKDASRFDRVKARNDKKKANREKDIVNISETPGFRGDQDLNDILKFLGADVDNTNVKNKKKHRGKKDDGREDKEAIKKKCKNSDRTCEELGEKCKTEEGKCKLDEENNALVNDVGRETGKKSKKEEDEKKANKKNKSGDAKKSKKNAGTLRESSSMEDLVSKSKQSNSVRDIRKQVTVDDGNMSLSGLNTYHSSKVDKLNNVLTNRPFIKEAGVVKNDNDVEVDHAKSDFVADFYSVGDSFLTADISLSPSSPAGGDFEVVSSKKKGKRSKNGYQNSKSLEYDKLSGNNSFGSTQGDDGFRNARFGQTKFSQKYNGHYERPHINFVEVPRTAHENTFIAQWSHLGVGDRYGAERYATTTTSAPHSEDSGSDGDDSVHSMPVPSITPRPDVRKPPPSSDSTPQTSYANIAKLAATANRAQMKRMTTTTIQTGSVALRELEGEPMFNENSENLDSKLPPVSESRPTNILDDNFPPLAESLGCVPCPSTASAMKVSESRTSQSSEDSAGQPGCVVVVQNVEQCKEASEGESNGVKKEPANRVAAVAGKASIDRISKSPNELVAAPVQTLNAQEKNSLELDVQKQPPSQGAQFYHQHAKQQCPPNLHYQQSTSPMYSPPPLHHPSQQPNLHLSNPTEHSNSSLAALTLQEMPPLHQPPPSLPQPLKPPHHTLPPPPLPQQPQHTLPPPPLPQQPPHTLPPPPHSNPKRCTQTSQSQASQQSQLAYVSHPSASIQQSPVQLGLQPQQSQQNQTSQLSSQPPTTHPYHPHSGSSFQQSAHSHTGMNQEKMPPCQQNMPARLNSHSKLTSQPPTKNPQVQESPPPQSLPHLEPSPPVEQNSMPKSSANLQSDANGLESGVNEDRQPQNCSKCPGRQTRNGPVAPSVQSGDASRGKKLEPAVVFTDNAKFSHSVSGIEFGFGFDEPIVTTSDNEDSVSENCLEEDSNLNNNNNNNNNLNLTVTKDFSKWFKAPKNDKISYNYEELIKHVSKAWEVTLQLMEKDPKNIQYWRAAESTEEA